MSIFGRFFGGKRNQSPPDDPEHAVLIHFKTQSLATAEIFEVEELLERTIDEAGTGELDGNDIATDGSGGTYYLYGPDADRLFRSVEDVLRRSNLTSTAKVVLRYGPPEDGVKELVVELAS